MTGIVRPHFWTEKARCIFHLESPAGISSLKNAGKLSQTFQIEHN